MGIGSQDSFYHREDMPAGSTYAVKNRIKRERSYARILYGCHGNMAAFHTNKLAREARQRLFGWEREPLFCPAACGGSNVRGIRLSVVYDIYNLNSPENYNKAVISSVCDMSRYNLL